MTIFHFQKSYLFYDFADNSTNDAQSRALEICYLHTKDYSFA